MGSSLKSLVFLVYHKRCSGKDKIPKCQLTDFLVLQIFILPRRIIVAVLASTNKTNKSGVIKCYAKSESAWEQQFLPLSCQE